MFDLTRNEFPIIWIDDGIRLVGSFLVVMAIA
jgi:hypothetical protein